MFDDDRVFTRIESTSGFAIKSIGNLIESH